MSLVKHEKKRVRQWTHKNCGGEVVHESTGPGYRWTKLPGRMPQKVEYKSRDGYKCAFCGFIPENEVVEKPMIVEKWEW